MAIPDQDALRAAILRWLPWDDNMNRAIGISSLTHHIDDEGEFPLCFVLDALLYLVEIGAVRKRRHGRSYPRYAKSRAWAERNAQ